MLNTCICIFVFVLQGCVNFTIRDADIQPFVAGFPVECLEPDADPCCLINNINADPVVINGIPLVASTIAAMYNLAIIGALYFNFHNDAENFYGIMRGQIYPVN